MTTVARRALVSRRSVLTTAAAVSIILGLTGWLVQWAAQSIPGATASAGIGPGRVGSRSAVPWKMIGPGWALALYSDGSTPLAGQTITLYLVDPLGGRYSMFTWPPGAALSGTSVLAWHLRAWSGDAKRALFVTSPAPLESSSPASEQQVYQLNLRTGRGTSIRLPRNASVFGYTRPDGAGILAQGTFNKAGRPPPISRYDMQGHLRKALLTGWTDPGGIAYSPSGRRLAVAFSQGLELVSNAGWVIRRLPVPGAWICDPVRWWSASVVLASCTADAYTGTGDQRLWLIPASGSRPTTLTPQRPAFIGPDQGDLNAWQLSGGLYLQANGANCDGPVIAKQLSHGRVKIIDVPGFESAVIVTATASQLLVLRSTPCRSDGGSLAWFNPVTGSVTVVMPRNGGNASGTVYDVVPYFDQGKR